MIPDRQELVLSKWYAHGNIAFKFEKRGKGTGTYVRGSVEDLLPFIRELHNIYSVPFWLEENLNRLNSVLESGKALQGDIICFYDDRIRQIVRCDDTRVEEGQYAGNAGYLELFHHEQYGGDYQGDPKINSSAMMVSYVLQALSSAAAAEKKAFPTASAVDQADREKGIVQRPAESRLSKLFRKLFRPTR